MTIATLLLVVGLLIVALQAFASWRVIESDEHERPAKLLQLVFIWLVPLIGAYSGSGVDDL